jgi:hypothetical protein
MAGDAALAIAMTVAREAVKREVASNPDATLEDRLKASMKEMSSFWMTTDDDLRFRGALGGVLETLDRDSADYNRLIREIEAIRNLSALMSGVPVDIARAFSESEDKPEPIGAIGMWREMNDR